MPPNQANRAVVAYLRSPVPAEFSGALQLGDTHAGESGEEGIPRALEFVGVG